MAIGSGTILILITLAVLPVAAIAFARSGGAWQRIGKGAFAIEQELPRRDSPAAPVDRALQEAEARQMLEAKSYRRQRRGLEPIDVEAEVRELMASSARPSVDEELRAEVRGMVVAANERRMRRGEEPLDVDAETERQLADFVGSG
jgi:hypothetical protein